MKIFEVVFVFWSALAVVFVSIWWYLHRRLRRLEHRLHHEREARLSSDEWRNVLARAKVTNREEVLR